jgi:hypothetical protein
MPEIKYDINKVMAEFGDDDFGFSTVDEEEYEAVIAEKDETVEEYKQRLQQVEKIILPFLNKLLKTADQAVIKWPNRKPVIEAQIQKILNLTRG